MSGYEQRTILKRNSQGGFTVLELMVVTLFIVVLGWFVFTKVADIQQKSRNNHRERDIKALNDKINEYYIQNGRYPTLANMNDASWRARNIKELDAGALKDPKDKSNGLLSAAPTANQYAYIVTPAGCTNAENNTNDCTGYKLVATYEGQHLGSATFELVSQN